MGRYVKINGVLVPIAGIGGQDTNYKGETMSDWEALTQEEKDQYDTVDLTEDYFDVLDELESMADQITDANEQIDSINNELIELAQKTSIGVFNTNASATYTSSLYAGDTHYFADAGTTFPAGNYIFFVNSYYTTEVYWQRTVVVPQGGTALMRAGTRREDNGKTSWPTSYSFYHSSNVPFTICPASYDAVTTGSASLKVYQYTLCWIKVTN